MKKVGGKVEGRELRTQNLALSTQNCTVLSGRTLALTFISTFLNSDRHQASHLQPVPPGWAFP